MKSLRNSRKREFTCVIPEVPISTRCTEVVIKPTRAFLARFSESGRHTRLLLPTRTHTFCLTRTYILYIFRGDRFSLHLPTQNGAGRALGAPKNLHRQIFPHPPTCTYTVRPELELRPVRIDTAETFLSLCSRQVELSVPLPVRISRGGDPRGSPFPHLCRDWFQFRRGYSCSYGHLPYPSSIPDETPSRRCSR